MKKTLLLIMIISLLGCDKNNDKTQDEKFFDYENVNQLNLLNLDNFWTDGVKIDTSFYMGAHFENHPGFLDGIRLYSGNGKAIWISVFQSKDEAINAMELRKNDVACVINIGDSDEIETQWWYSECMDYAIYVNQHNVIVEIDFSSNATFDVIKSILINTANEIIDRIDLLSN